MSDREMTEADWARRNTPWRRALRRHTWFLTKRGRRRHSRGRRIRRLERQYRKTNGSAT